MYIGNYNININRLKGVREFIWKSLQRLGKTVLFVLCGMGKEGNGKKSPVF
jgi:hypothetical protein